MGEKKGREKITSGGAKRLLEGKGTTSTGGEGGVNKKKTTLYRDPEE